MTRSEVYDEIVKYNLQNKVKALYGRNFTNVSTQNLISVVTNYKLLLKKNNPPTNNTMVALIDLLYKKHILCKSEYESLKA
jgi:hypothetical protein